MRPSFRRGVLCGLVAAACAGESPEPTPRIAPEVDSLARATDEEIRLELETLGHEIADLEAYLGSGAARPDGASGLASGADPDTLLERARRARDVASRRASQGNLEDAADSLTAAAAHLEQVKRALALAEEWGEEFAPDSGR